MGDSVLEELVTACGKAKARVPFLQVRLRVEPDGAGSAAMDRIVDQRCCETPPAEGGIRDDAADPSILAVAEETHVRRDGSVLFDPHHERVCLEVPAVELGVGTFLLDDEDIDSQAKDRVERFRLKRAEGTGVDLDLGGSGHPCRIC